MTVRWRVHPAQPHRASALARPLKIDPLTAQLLLNRGVTEPRQAEQFLSPSLNTLASPWRLPDMELGIRRLQQAIARRESILIFGDSDVDGLTASVILYELLRDAGATVQAQQANRIADGYGVPDHLITQLCQSSITLLVLVDCGTNQHEAIRRLAAQGIDTIIVDHHVLMRQRPPAVACINPHTTSGPGRELCSAGLALKVAQAFLEDTASASWHSYLDLAALGLLADHALLRGDARVIVANGLHHIVRSRRKGLARLCEATATVRPDPEPILRRLVPRLNASGRLGDASAVWHLLHGHDTARIEEWCVVIEQRHRETKQLHRRLMAQATEQVNRLHFKDQYVLVVSRQGWHPGLMGPLAFQLSKRYGRPAVALSMQDRHGTGSGRSLPCFNLLEALRACEGFLVKFGGHAQACGLTLAGEHLEPLRARLNQRARLEMGREGLIPTRLIDLALALREVRPEWVEELARLEPFGHGNPTPTMLFQRLVVEVTSPRKALLCEGAVRVDATGEFATCRDGGAVEGQRRYDVVATPTITKNRLVLTVKDVRDAVERGTDDLSSSTLYRHESV